VFGSGQPRSALAALSEPSTVRKLHTHETSPGARSSSQAAPTTTSRCSPMLARRAGKVYLATRYRCHTTRDSTSSVSVRDLRRQHALRHGPQPTRGSPAPLLQTSSPVSNAPAVRPAGPIDGANPVVGHRTTPECRASARTRSCQSRRRSSPPTLLGSSLSVAALATSRIPVGYPQRGTFVGTRSEAFFSTCSA
jgi:hypothetical protein